LFYELDT